jgi:hypothetical protein
MAENKTLYCFGSSTTLNFSELSGLGNPLHAWPHILANNINHSVKVYASAGICNNYISDEVIKHIDNISTNDTVVILWGHWSRVLFCMETDTPSLNKIKNDSLCYPSHSLSNNITWVRSKGLQKRAWALPHNVKKYNFPYYDHYFENYYFDHQQHLDNLKRILLIKLLLSERGINYIFTTHDKYKCNIYPESYNVEQLLADANWFYPDDMGLIELSNKNKWYISKQDQHFGNIGHTNIANLLTDEIKKY